MTKKIKISVAMASFNEEEAIGNMIDEIEKYSKDFDLEIVVVDSSSDKTAQIARDKGAVVIYQEPQGHGLALRAAIGAASHDIIITTDCDNTYPMEFIPKLVDLIKEGYDFISCNRLTKNLKKEMPFSNKMANKLFAFLVSMLYKIKVHDVSTGMFCMTKAARDKMQWETNYSFPCETIIKAYASEVKCREVDIPYRIRVGDITLQKWRSGKAYLRCIFNYCFNLKIDPKYL